MKTIEYHCSPTYAGDLPGCGYRWEQEQPCTTQEHCPKCDHQCDPLRVFDEDGELEFIDLRKWHQLNLIDRVLESVSESVEELLQSGDEERFAENARTLNNLLDSIEFVAKQALLTVSTENERAEIGDNLTQQCGE